MVLILKKALLLFHQSLPPTKEGFILQQFVFRNNYNDMLLKFASLKQSITRIKLIMKKDCAGHASSCHYSVEGLIYGALLIIRKHALAL